MLKLKTEKEIIQSWECRQEALLSVLCITYNHERYIEDAIQGILTQKTTFPFEVLIHDDASIDSTVSIIKKYETNYPSIIKVVYQIENQYSKGVKPLLNFLLPKAQGKYLAFCEGDDYWDDPNKLQQQFDLMELNQHVNLCFHTARMIDYFKNNKEMIVGGYKHISNIVPANEIILRSYGYFPTASMFIRRESLQNFTAFRNRFKYLTIVDYYLQIFSSYPNGALFIDKPMSVYRYGIEGSATKNYTDNHEFQVRHAHSIYDTFMYLNEYSNFEYDYEFKMAILTNAVDVYTLIKDTKFIEQYRFKGIKNIFEKLVDDLNQNYQRIGIYGGGIVCKSLLKNLGDKVEFILDARQPSGVFEGKNMINLNDFKGSNVPVFISVTGRCQQIKKDLESFNLNIISIDDYFLDNFDNIFSK